MAVSLAAWWPLVIGSVLLINDRQTLLCVGSPGSLMQWEPCPRCTLDQWNRNLWEWDPGICTFENSAGDSKQGENQCYALKRVGGVLGML